MAPKPRAPQLIQHYVTGGDRSLRDWHQFLRRVTFGAALVLMAASVVSLHWACNLIGFTGWWEPVAWAVPLAMETGMAAVASTATTIRKDPKPGREDKPGSYYLSLWLIFSFVMLLAQAANIGHAVTTVAGNAGELPSVIPVQAVYFFACGFAALFPLGGTMFVHVSGFLRARGTGARWIGEDAELVMVEAAPGAPAAQQPRAQSARKSAAAPARPAPATRASASEQPARETAARAESARNSDQPASARAKSNDALEAAYEAYRDARDGGREMDGNEIAELLGKHPGYARNVRNQKFRPRYEAERADAQERAADPAPSDPIEQQVDAERDQRPGLTVAR